MPPHWSKVAFGELIKRKKRFVYWVQFVAPYKRWIRPVVFENVRKVLDCRTPVLGCHIYQCIWKTVLLPINQRPSAELGIWGRPLEGAGTLLCWWLLICAETLNWNMVLLLKYVYLINPNIWHRLLAYAIDNGGYDAACKTCPLVSQWPQPGGANSTRFWNRRKWSNHS